MAFVLLNHVNWRERHFEERVALNNITDYDHSELLGCFRHAQHASACIAIY